MSEFNECPNLEIVRKQLKQYIINQPPVPDCEINYELGYMYDPLYEIKDWYCNHYDIGDKYYCKWLNNTKITPKNERLGFNIFWRGYIHDPWNVEKNVDIQGNPLIRPGCSLQLLRMFYDYKECCKKKDWKTFVDKHIKRLNFFIHSRPINNTEIRDKINDDILMKRIRNYFQLDVMSELLWRSRRKIFRRKTVVDETITCNYKFDIFNGFKFTIYKTTDEFCDDYCYGIYTDPMCPFRYEIDVVREQNTNRFRNIYENHTVNAQFCFELYIWILRQYSTKIGLLNTQNNSRLFKF